MNSVRTLDSLQPGQSIPFGGDRITEVSAELAAAFQPGDRVVVVQDSGALLHIPFGEHSLVAEAVEGAHRAFTDLATVADSQITAFFDAFAALLADEAVFAEIVEANTADVASAAARGRSTTRLVLSPSMRDDMVAGLRTWRDTSGARDVVTEDVQHDGWSVTARRAPLGVVGFVFEGRPNVFADATGVLRTGNTAVLRIGSDALGTATAIMRLALQPALLSAGLPVGSVVLVESPSRAAGWALFGDHRLALAVARGSGQAVAQLGAVARQAGVPVSLHGTGGAWMIVSSKANVDHFRSSVLHSLDRKVCNTLNVCCIERSRADELVPAFVDALRSAASVRGVPARLHVEAASGQFVDAGLFVERVVVGRADGNHDESFATMLPIEQTSTEWEWETSPEVTLVVVDDIDAGIDLFNVYSPRLTASLISDDPVEHRRFADRCDAPFIGNGFTRWVDGQFALDRPELGLSNWENGRLFARSAVLSGDSVFTVRLTATVTDFGLHR